jgi:hypothetical protein
MPRILIDNTPTTAVFDDSNRLSDAMANFGRALVESPAIAAKIRQEREDRDYARAIQEAAGERADNAQRLQEAWHAADDKRANKAMENQRLYQENTLKQTAARLDAEEKWRKDELNRRMLSDLGSGLDNAAKRITDLFKGSTTRNGSTGWHEIKDIDGTTRFFRTGLDGNLQTLDPSTGKITHFGPDGAPATSAPAVNMPSNIGSVDPAHLDALDTLGRSDPARLKALMGELQRQSPEEYKQVQDALVQRHSKGGGMPYKDPTARTWWWNSGIPSAREFNASQDASVANPHQPPVVPLLSGDVAAQPNGPRQDQAPRVDEWLPVLANRSNPGYQQAIQKLRNWKRGVDERGNPFPQGPQWAAQVLSAIEAQNSRPGITTPSEP